MTVRDVIVQRIRSSGPLPFALYADLALYHPTLGYYSRAARRSGRAGDFHTSVDLGPLFGELLASQFAEMWRLVTTESPSSTTFDLVEAAAGSGRLARDVLDAAVANDPAFYDAVRVRLVERSAAARDAHATTLGPHAAKLLGSDPDLAGDTTGVIFANELLDALPPNVVMMTDDGLREVYVDIDDHSGQLVERLGPLSSGEVEAHIDRWGIRLEPGWRAEISPAAVTWVRRAAGTLTRGFLLLIDYGHDADELYSAAHAAGTLTTYHRHRVAVGPDPAIPAWLVDPGDRDISAHVDLTAVRHTAERAGLQTIGVLDQTYFLLGLGAADHVAARVGDGGVAGLKRRLALKSLLMPGGLGSTHKVLVFGRGVGTPRLSGCSYRGRLT